MKAVGVELPAGGGVPRARYGSRSVVRRGRRTAAGTHMRKDGNPRHSQQGQACHQQSAVTQSNSVKLRLDELSLPARAQIKCPCWEDKGYLIGWRQVGEGG